MIALNLRIVAQQLGIDMERFHEEFGEVPHASHDTDEHKGDEA
ncbi:hypothetical protein [Paenibacillus mucilaginosus]|uniref:Uncharacterized protein n=3 Tax=Paenibacillus mucilaginosus TaxID=61624 RepID=H6NN56_9BACL|nr:hypothetical protein [Paenibacillus mucilaginosus]AEI44180.1 hypothetical protein KNP414_05656 [Paenibacillus mucilaginosus KNP414]AFC31732.1 hypothetical protein PM3016_5000 [Paenibacillus mucilaginosus 3016]AFH64084.1 hypothetical protein B2K_25930 [Paenibacillus mucilaginosus K02]